MALAEFPILVTRAEPGASETVARLRAMQLSPVPASMLTLRMREAERMPAHIALSGLVFTSANGVRTYADQRTDRNLCAWCVGPATAEAARAAGFEQVQQSSGNAADLAAFILNHRAPDLRPLLHVANAAAAGGLKRALEAAGIAVIFAPLYEMTQAVKFSEGVHELLANGIPGVVLIHSAKGAAAFAALACAFDLSAWRAVAISDPAAAPLSGLYLQDIAVAKHPDEDGLFAALATLSA